VRFSLSWCLPTETRSCPGKAVQFCSCFCRVLRSGHAGAPVCGPYTTLQIFDNGDGSSKCNFGTTTVQNCTGNPINPSTICGRVAATSLTVTIQNLKNLPAASYVQPDISKWLQNIGFSSINVLQSSLTVEVLHVDGPVPPIAPVFFTDLEEVERGILVRECGNDCSVSPAAPALASLLGLSNVIRLSQYLTVQATAFQNFASFKKLTCPFPNLYILENTKLSSFDGLQGIQPLPSGNQTILGTGSGPFLAANALDGIKPLLGCPVPASDIVYAIAIPVGCNTVLSTPQEVCNFNGGPICRLAAHPTPACASTVFFPPGVAFLSNHYPSIVPCSLLHPPH
jgi:hypothetical protein